MFLNEVITSSSKPRMYSAEMPRQHRQHAKVGNNCVAGLSSVHRAVRIQVSSVEAEIKGRRLFNHWLLLLQ